MRNSRLLKYPPISDWLKLQIPFIGKYLMILLFAIPLAYWFTQSGDIYNVIEDVLIVPMYFALIAALLSGLDDAFCQCIDYFDDESIRFHFHANILCFPLTNRINYTLLLSLISVTSLYTQLDLIVDDLRFVNHNPAFHKWIRFYDPNYPLPNKDWFFEYYITGQFIATFFIILSLLAFFEYLFLANFLFQRHVHSYNFSYPEKYLVSINLEDLFKPASL